MGNTGKRTAATALGVGLAIAVCAAVSGVSPSAMAKSTVVFAYKALAGAETDAFKWLIADFEKRNPDVKIKAINLIASGGSWIEKLLTMVAGGQPIDVMNMEYQFAVPLMLKGLVLSLEDVMKSDKSFDIKAYAKSSVDAFTLRGRRYGIPYTAQTHNLFANKESISKAGLSFPKNDWTVDDLTDIAKKTTKDKNGDGKPDFFGLAFDVSATRTANLIYPFGGRLTTANKEKCTLAAPESVRGYKWLEDMVNGQKVAVASSGQSRFEGNQVTFYTGGPWMVSQLRSKCKFPWDILPYPKGPGGRGATLGADAFIISASSKVKKPAWALVKHFTSAEGLRRLAAVGASLPSRKDARGEMFSGTKAPANVAAFDIGLDAAISSPVTSAWTRVSEIYSQMVNDMLARKKGVEAALTSASALIDALLAKDLKQ